MVAYTQRGGCSREANSPHTVVSAGRCSEPPPHTSQTAALKHKRDRITIPEKKSLQVYSMVISMTMSKKSRC